MNLAEQAGSTTNCWNISLNEAILLTHLGRWDEVAVLWDRPILRDRAPGSALLALMTLQLSVIALARGDAVDLATLDAVASIGESGQLESLDDMYYTATRVIHARATGDVDGMARVCRRLVELAAKFSPIDDDFPNLWNVAVEAMIATQDFAVARELVEPVAAISPTRLNPLLAAQLARLRGTIEACDPSSDADAAEVEKDLLDGITGLDAFGAVPYRARAQATLGAWLTRRGRPAEAGPQLAAARATFIELRASAWLDELESALSLAAAG